MKSFEFGVLPVPIEIETDNFKIELAEDYEIVIENFIALSNPDGFLYPPIVATYKESLGGSKEKINNSEREAKVFRLPRSHILSILHPEIFVENDIPSIADLVIYYLGFVFGYRCQKANKWLDGRVNTQSYSDHSNPNYIWIEKSIEKLLSFWCLLDARIRRVVINALFLHNRASKYHWDWERFMIEYQVTDALYRVANEAHGGKARPHADRIEAMCQQFKIWYTPKLLDNIVNLRNDLIHEALWDENLPTEISYRGMYAPSLLHSLNERLLFGLLGYNGKYLQSKWTGRVLHLFDLEN